jgi:tRNA A-37 threonylcarbamoyl transferase component Bud32
VSTPSTPAAFTDKVPLLEAAQLIAQGREPGVPFRIALGGGDELTLIRLLRVLPGKRIVGEGVLNGRRVLAKLFIARGSARHWAQERAGIEALHHAGIATPGLLLAAPLAAGGHALLTDFLASAESLAEAWLKHSGRPPGHAEALAALSPAFTLLGRMHAAGLVQEDLHLGNFLNQAGRLFVIDGDAVRAVTPGQPLDARHAMPNLAILLAQLPASWTAQQDRLLAAYRLGGGRVQEALAHLPAEILRVRDGRLKSFLAKTVRDCTLFSVRQGLGRFVAAVREKAPALSLPLAAPDAQIGQGMLLKDGATCTVARVESAAGPLVIKRYNLKNLRHALSRAWRPSRAWHSWQAGHRLQFLGIPTPAPLALIEERLGPLRRRAWLITEFCPGPDLLTHLSANDEPPAAEARAIVALFQSMQEQRISHGDLKATNLLWHEGRILVIDLDATVQHHSAAEYARAWRRDRARLLRNWPASSVLHRWLNDTLPPV